LNVVSLLSAAITCWRAKLINWQVGLPVLVVAVILSPLGALLTQRVNKSVLLLLNWLGLDPKVAAGTTTHAQFAGEPHGHHSSEADARGHGFEPAAQGRHARMAEAIADCDVLLARGMGARGI
jgi:hypothetical protein